MADIDIVQEVEKELRVGQKNGGDRLPRENQGTVLGDGKVVLKCRNFPNKRVLSFPSHISVFESRSGLDATITRSSNLVSFPHQTLVRVSKPTDHLRSTVHHMNHEPIR